MKKVILPILAAVLCAAILMPGNAQDAEGSKTNNAKLIDLAALVRGKSAEEAPTNAKQLMEATAKIEGTEAEAQNRIADLAAVLFSAVIKGKSDVNTAVAVALVAGAPDEHDDIVIAVISAIADTYLKGADANNLVKAAIAASGDKESVYQAAIDPGSALSEVALTRVNKLAKKVAGSPNQVDRTPDGGAGTEASSSSTTSTSTSSTTSTTTSSSTSTSTTRPSPTPVGLR